ncbi:RNA polymerase sigma factor [Okeania hirsuta]|uniref:RNA polymerase sigma factor n=1 Tax=Okeania hirsuta TaxID=1458930 RepID=UPI0030DBD6EE
MPIIEEYRHLSALKNGEQSSLEWIYAKYFQIIFLYCKKLIGIEVLAEEATSEVFLTLWEKRSIISTDKSIQAFCIHIAKVRLNDHLKKIANDQRLKSNFY